MSIENNWYLFFILRFLKNEDITIYHHFRKKMLKHFENGFYLGLPTVIFQSNSFILGKDVNTFMIQNKFDKLILPILFDKIKNNIKDRYSNLNEIKSIYENEYKNRQLGRFLREYTNIDYKSFFYLCI